MSGVISNITHNIHLTISGELTKHDIRQAVWEFLEKEGLACFPRPVIDRIPNFKGADIASQNVAVLEEFKNARNVKVCPDKPQEEIRFLTLEARKTLFVPTPRLRCGLFNKINPPTGCGKNVLRICATSQGVREYSVPVDLNSKVKIDLIIIGSVAVSRQGRRIGKGEGFADLGYAMMMKMGAITAETTVVSTVHDCQVFDTLPEFLFSAHDVNVDVIVTPTQVIRCSPRLSKPNGIIWSCLTAKKYRAIPILKKMREIDKRCQKDVRLKDDIHT